MASERYKSVRPYPSHFDQSCKCRCGKKAEWYVIVQRESRSGNLRELTTGPYCTECKDKKMAT